MRLQIGRISEYKKLFWLGAVILFSIVLYERIYLLEPFFKIIISDSAYLSWHMLFEFISIFISFCIFIIPYYTYRQTHRLRGILIANTFLAAGIIDTFHTLSYKGMPSFLIENYTANRATTFWIIARLIGAIGIALASLIKTNTKSNVNRGVFSAVSVLLSLFVLVIATYFPGVFPVMYIEGVGVTQIKKILEYVVIMFLCFAGVIFLKQFLKNKDNSNLVFVIAIIAGIFSELAFVRYYSVYDIYNYIGHVYKFISYFIVFRVTFINNIERPYLELSKAKNKLKEHAGDLNRIVAERTNDLQQANKELNLINCMMLEDLEYARGIQQAMLPDKLPESSLVTFDARYYPAERVSGDFYNIFRLDEYRIGMYIGDVSGHGVPAAMLTVFLNQGIKTTRELEGNRFEILEPSKVLENLYILYNSVNFKDEVYILVLYAIYDIRTQVLSYSSAGLNTRPLLIKSNSEITEIDIAGLPICNLMKVSPANYTDKTIQLGNGDKVFFYTDGLTDEALTLEHFKDFLSANNSISCTEINDEIDKKIKSISGSCKQKDDVTFFMLQVN